MTLVKRKDGFFPSVFSDFFDTGKFFDTDVLDTAYNKWIPAVNITESNKSFTVEMAAPGLKKNDFKVEVDDNVLTISAERENEKKEENEKYTRREFVHTSFSRSFTLPEGIKSEKIEGKYDDGILYVTLPKTDSKKNHVAKQVKVV